MFELLLTLSLIITGYITGRIFEQRHYKSIHERERLYHHIPTITGEWKSILQNDEESLLVGGSVVIGSDYFKTFVAGLRSFFGGRMSSLESVIDRGRREATLRAKKRAHQWGASKIINFRIETASIGPVDGRRSLPCVELHAYGTAIRKRK